MQRFSKFTVLFLCLALISCGLGRSGSETGRAANKYLWNASLDTLSFLPVEQADPFSGLLVTGWGRAPGATQEYRVTVFVAGAALDATGLKVSAFRRAGTGERPAAAQTVQAIEDAILARARDLRIKDARG